LARGTKCSAAAAVGGGGSIAITIQQNGQGGQEAIEGRNLNNVKQAHTAHEESRSENAVVQVLHWYMKSGSASSPEQRVTNETGLGGGLLVRLRVCVCVWGGGRQIHKPALLDSGAGAGASVREGVGGEREGAFFASPSYWLYYPIPLLPLLWGCDCCFGIVDLL
jgi:hypothetical protein